jgi:hypothetical protein
MTRFGLAMVLAIIIALPITACVRRASPEDLKEMARLGAHVEALASRIGPRPSGSPGERAARDYILEQLGEAGLQARLDTFDHALLSPGTEVRIQSANVVGSLPGTRGEAILVGSHYDSRNESCPGASDDASGVAVMIEAARILAGRSHRKTLIFASFAGEETFGLPGSHEFVQSWKGVPIRLAITLDFVGSGRLFLAPFPIPPQLWANRMLRRAEREVQTRRVSFDPWLAIVPRLIPVQFSADHESFQAAGIPALNLSCQFPAWTYHTPEDTSGRVEEETLLAARDLVVRMVEDADSRQPDTSSSDGAYLPFPLFGYPFFLSESLLRALAVMGLVLAGATMARFRRDLTSLAGLGEAVRSVLVSIPLTALAVSGPFLAERILGRLGGVRHPGYAHPGAHLGGALLAAAFTLWVSLFLARFLRPSTLPGAYLAPAILIEGSIAGVFLALGRAELSFPFAVAASAMLLASWSQHALRRLGLGILGGVALLPFLSPVTYRMFLELSGFPLPRYSLELSAAVLFLPWFLFSQHIACLPEALYARPGGIFFRPITGGVLGLLALGAAWGNAVRPAYDSGHRALVTLREDIDLARHRAVAFLSSLESLRAVHLSGLQEKVLPDDVQAQVRVPFPVLDLPGLSVESEGDLHGEAHLRIRGHPPGHPRWVALRFQAGKSLEVEHDGIWQAAEPYHLVFFPEGPEGDQLVHLRRSDREPLTMEGDISYDSDLLDLRPQAPFRTFRVETRVHFRKRLL